MITIGSKQEFLIIKARPIPYEEIAPAITRHRDENAGVVTDRTKRGTAKDVSVLFTAPLSE